MRVLLVVHGYPPRYNAGSEVYTQTLARALAVRHQVMVFSRLEDPYQPPYLEFDESDDGCPDAGPIPIRMINMPHFRDRYRHERVDAAFARCLKEFAPDVVHIQHLNHLSTSLVTCAARLSTPVVFTLHDFWLQCPRGQFLQFFPESEATTLGLCDGQADSKCASRCYAPRYGSGAAEEQAASVRHFTDWVRQRMKHVREITTLVDLFIAPSRQLARQFEQAFGVSAKRVAQLDYGFDLQRLHGRRRQPEADGGLVFGYIGTHVPAKGIHQLLDAFARLDGNVRLRLWGRAHPEFTPPLLARQRRLPAGVRERITWEGEYPNHEIVTRVFNQVDAIVVPSIWLENSPLVIHEAQQARVPVITADAGGMAELVHHEVNGLLFEHRNSAALAAQMGRLMNDPDWAARLGQRGYLFSSDGDVPSVDQHTREIERLYASVLHPQAAREEVHA
ncbi:MAG: glycosyltransferase [Proteobacteria bacterium]|nr:glycosyltransferase [Pseudomonadota bacterium]